MKKVTKTVSKKKVRRPRKDVKISKGEKVELCSLNDVFGIKEKPLKVKKGEKVHKKLSKVTMRSLNIKLIEVLDRLDFILKKLGYNDGSIAPSEWIAESEIDANVRKIKGIKE